MTAQIYQFPIKTSIAVLSRKPLGESDSERLWRLALKAELQGVRVLRMHGSERLMIATSATQPDTCYAVDLRTGRCTCEGNHYTGACKHVAAALAELGELPDPTSPAPFVLLPRIGSADEPTPVQRVRTLVSARAMAA